MPNSLDGKGYLIHGLRRSTNDVERVSERFHGIVARATLAAQLAVLSLDYAEDETVEQGQSLTRRKQTPEKTRAYRKRSSKRVWPQLAQPGSSIPKLLMNSFEASVLLTERMTDEEFAEELSKLEDDSTDDMQDL